MATAYKPWVVRLTAHPGSSAEDIANEPNWGAGHQHRIGFRNRNNRVPGLTHDPEAYGHEIEGARQEQEQLRADVRAGKLVNFRDVIQHQEVGAVI